MVSRNGRPRGGQPDYALDRNGRPVIGLSCNGHDGRYYATHSHPRKWFGRDFDTALVRFRELEDRQAGRKRRLVIDSRPATRLETALWMGETDQLPDDPSGEGPGPLPDTLPDVDVIETRSIRDDLWWSQVAQAIREDPALAAQKTGLPLDRLHAFQPPSPSVPLGALLALYFSKPKALTVTTRRAVDAYWHDFLRCVKVSTVGELTADLIGQYHDRVYRDYHEGHRSPSYVKARFVAVKVVFNYALKRGKDAERLEKVVALCRMLVPPAANGINPKPISRTDFRALLSAADAKWKAILLLSMNAAYYPTDIAQCRKDSLNIEDGTLRDFRTKTGVPRVAVLWPRTVKAIQKYQRESPHESPYLFVSSVGLPYSPNHIGRGFRRLRTLAGVAASVEFNHIRDGSQTAAILGGADPVTTDMLLGHKTGIRDNYLLRNPTMVKNACEAIQRFYFQS